MESKTKREMATEYLRAVVAPLCGHPELIQVEDVLDERGLLLTLRAHAEDMSLLIGRKGSCAEALKKVMHIWGTRHIASVRLKIDNFK